MNKKVALVLSSGGARGMAHIGVVESLVANGFEITSISGSSIGALVGAFHASGDLTAYKDWILKLDKFDLFKLFDFTFSTQGFIKGEKVFNELKKFIPDQKIENLPIPFSAVSTDIRNQKEVVFDSGSMYEAVRASVSVPTVLKPVSADNMELIDGAVINPLPIDRIKRTPDDILVVVNVSAKEGFSPPKKSQSQESSYLNSVNEFLDKWSKYLPGSANVEKKLGYFDLMNRSIDLMQDKMTEFTINKYNPEILVNISKDACSTFEFYRAEELIETGKKAFESAFEKYNQSSNIDQ
ncbi:MAG: patatin-like phospholipase family protein [Cyclobacteriaceae bacterium]